MKRAATLLAFAFLLAAAPAFAQKVTPPLTAVPQTPGAQIQVAPTQTYRAPTTPGVVARAIGGAPFVVASTAPAGGERRTEAGPNGAAALQFFSFEFQNGDHSIKTIRASRRENETSLNFADNDGNDKFAATVSYLPLAPQFEVRRVSRSCFEACWLTLDATVARDQVYVLTGFSFERRDSDADIVNFSIIPYPQYGLYEIQFQDSNERVRVADVQIEFAVVPRDLVGARTLCFTGSACAVGVSPQNNVIEGFQCAYAGGEAANLLAVAIDSRSATNAGHFQDNNTDDLGRCRVMIASLK